MKAVQQRLLGSTHLSPEFNFTGDGSMEDLSRQPCVQDQIVRKLHGLTPASAGNIMPPIIQAPDARLPKVAAPLPGSGSAELAEGSGISSRSAPIAGLGRARSPRFGEEPEGRQALRA